MKKALPLFLFTLIICCSFSARKMTNPKKGFVVIEMFSSEGCSSCPSGEKVMEQILQKGDSSVYILDFHVDYWDYLGWKDTFAIPANTARQEAYGSSLKLSSVYTPQAVINGKTEMVASDEEKINAAIKEGLQETIVSSIICKAAPVANSKVAINYSITGDTTNCLLNIALVESELVVKVQKGENEGKILHHSNVVRAFKTIKITSANGRYEFELPHVDLTHSKIICYLQHSTDLHIVAATQMSIPQ